MYTLVYPGIPMYTLVYPYADDTNLTFSGVDLSILQTEMSGSKKNNIEYSEKTDFMVIGFWQRIAT